VRLVFKLPLRVKKEHKDLLVLLVLRVKRENLVLQEVLGQLDLKGRPDLKARLDHQAVLAADCHYMTPTMS
jgi:hypothetical protein